MPSKDAFKELKTAYSSLKKTCREQEEALARQWIYLYNHSGELVWNTVLDTSKGLGRSLLQQLFGKEQRASVLARLIFSVAQLLIIKKINDWRKRRSSARKATA
jgi:hypothetical protein